MKNPYLSIVAVCRNDDYGGNLLHRMQLFLDNQFALWEKYGLEAELLIVEWNPPQDKPLLKDVLRWPNSPSAGSVRIVQVPREIHDKVTSPGRGPLLEYEGKNVGIRRAQGDYILATNIDLLYSEELISFFASGKLKKDVIYRVDRYDLDEKKIPVDMSTADQLAYCASKVALVNNRYGAGFLKNEKKMSGRNLKRFLTYARNWLRHFPFPVPYTNAAGDFILMSRESWNSLRGISIANNEALIDGVCYSGIALGLKQIILESSMRIYHVNHEHAGRDAVHSDAAKYKKKYIKMLKEHKPLILNDENWGLANEILPEYKIF